ncbi:hypothetical protein QTN47_14885 [Danxiaibacter flavus]|uniref:Sulfotransferase family protein n=1 Tax=Danxiaibacter flavus TaxID=3049108 RepID=A0ABV3ZGW3_9BACT|nr:hypothetical protein QNM32_14895 [Chitinophagaceae bacterium DXS]
MHTSGVSDLYNYIPYSLKEGKTVQWLKTGNIPYTDPFFDTTLFKIKYLPENQKKFKSSSSVDMLSVWSKEQASIKPSAIIFHVSRCGSTLLSQLLSLNEKHIVLSEVPFFDDLLRSKYKENGKDYSHLLKDAVAFYGQKRKGNEEQLFIKADSWHLFFYEEWRAIYPQIPFILLFRRPDEVVRSQMKNKGLHAVPGMIEKEIFQLGELPEVGGAYEIHVAAVLEQYYKKMQQIAVIDNNVHLFNYKDGIENIALKVLHSSGIQFGKGSEDLYNERMHFDAKDPYKVFDEKPLSGLNTDEHLQNAFMAYKALDAIRKSSLQQV